MRVAREITEVVNFRLRGLYRRSELAVSSPRQYQHRVLKHTGGQQVDVPVAIEIRRADECHQAARNRHRRSRRETSLAIAQKDRDRIGTGVADGDIGLVVAVEITYRRGQRPVSRRVDITGMEVE